MNPGFDPSKMDPKLLMQMSQLVQQLPPAQLSRMQTLMHNAMAGFDVRREMEEFEKSLPPGFREKIMAMMGSQTFSAVAPDNSNAEMIDSAEAPVVAAVPHSMSEARLTVLRAVADGQMTPEEAEKVLFN